MPPTPPRVFLPDSHSAIEPDVDEVWTSENGLDVTSIDDQAATEIAQGAEIDASVTEFAPGEVAIPAAPEAAAPEPSSAAAISASGDDSLPGPDAPDMRAVAEEDIRAALADASGEPRETAGDADAETDIDTDRPSFLRWTPEEERGDEPIDLSLPDFPSIDIPTLEDEERRRD